LSLRHNISMNRPFWITMALALAAVILVGMLYSCGKAASSADPAVSQLTIFLNAMIQKQYNRGLYGRFRPVHTVQRIDFSVPLWRLTQQRLLQLPNHFNLCKYGHRDCQSVTNTQ